MSSSTEKQCEPKDVATLSRLALRVYRQLMIQDKKENILFSPITLLKSLEEINLASHGKSREQLQECLQIAEDSLTKLLHDCQQIFTAGDVDDDGQKDRTYDWLMATRVLAAQDVQFHSKFKEQLQSLPGEKGKELTATVSSDQKDIQQYINQLADQVTHHRITSLDIHHAPTIPKNSMLFLSITTFFSDWENQFLKRTCTNYETQMQNVVQALPATVEAFHNADGTTVDVVMVHLEGRIFFTRDEELKVTILELPMNKYTNSLVIVLPDDTGKDGLRHFEEKLTEDFFDILRKHWQMPKMHVYLPKFSLQRHLSLGKTLEALGVKDIFSHGKADLTNVNSTGGVYVSDIIHSSNIDISCESGEALPPYKPRAGECSGVLELDTFARGFHVNRPFFFLVRPRHPEVWSLMGRVVQLPADVDVQIRSHHKRKHGEE